VLRMDWLWPRRTGLETGDATSCILYRCEQGMDSYNAD